ncbi:VCBS domain-containing protein [Aeromonas salmonicida]|uniref:VCBS domain-containing protein n=1 Tax=Aeromonas salmonicida TaxID=645 RepID=UPI003D315712
MDDDSTPSPDALGSLTVTDVDGADEAKFIAGNASATHDHLGSLAISAGGAWPNNGANRKVQ